MKFQQKGRITAQLSSGSKMHVISYKPHIAQEMELCKETVMEDSQLFKAERSSVCVLEGHDKAKGPPFHRMLGGGGK